MQLGDPGYRRQGGGGGGGADGVWGCGMSELTFDHMLSAG
jgi:hypothetical protein